MPGLLQFISDLTQSSNSPATSDNSEDLSLWLPSEIPLNRQRAVCFEGLPEMEARLRKAQCLDSLEGIRHVLRIKTRLIQFKNKNIRGQRGGTRSRAVIDRVHERAQGFVLKYRAARAAALALVGEDAWDKSLQELLDGDIRAYTDPNHLQRGPGRRGTREDDVEEEDELVLEDPSPLSLLPEIRTRHDGTGETRRTLSWIWMMEAANPTGTNADGDDDILHAEWAKSRARADRAKEEVLLVREEMRRVLEFLRWRANWWRERTQRRRVADTSVMEGIKAYSLEQANIHDSLSLHFRTVWKTPLQDVSVEEAQSDVDDDGDDEVREVREDDEVDGLEDGVNEPAAMHEYMMEAASDDE